MALINCAECGKRISDQSSECVGCGAPAEIYSKNKSWDGSGTLEAEVHTLAESVSLRGASAIVKDEITTEVHEDKEDRVVKESKAYDVSEYETKLSNRLYAPIYLSNTVFFIVFLFLDMAITAAAGQRVNPLATFITFWIVRYLTRRIFVEKQSFRHGKILMKVLVTLGFWIATILVKQIVLITALNFVF